MGSKAHVCQAGTDTLFNTVPEQVCQLASSHVLWDELRGAHLFITGGTGFIGRWLLETLALAEARFNLGLRVCMLTRNPNRFSLEVPLLASHPAFRFVTGDVRDFDFPAGDYSHFLHLAAVSADATFNKADPLIQFDIAYQGTRRVLEFAAHCGARRLLLTSSGSVYGAAHLRNEYLTPEDYIGAPLPSDLSAAPEHGKRAAEFLCEYYRQKHGVETIIARCFTFVGPRLPLDIHYAIGNFIRDALWGDEITVHGDGTPIRSYLYIADLLIWLLVMLTRAPSGSLFNVGSDVPLSILELAMLVRDTLALGKPVKVIGRQHVNLNRNIYVPNIECARATLQLDVWTDLAEAILRTGNWYRKAIRERR